MKRTLINLIVVMQVVLTSAWSTGPARAAQVESGTVFTFGDLGYAERLMTGPYDSFNVFYSLPPTWKLTPNASLHLRFRFEGGQSQSLVDGSETGFIGGTLRVTLNRAVIATIVIDRSGEWDQLIPLSETALQPAVSGRHNLTLLFESYQMCDAQTISATLIVSEQSSFDFQHEVIPPSIDLSKFPVPFYQPRAILSTGTTIVVPDNPSETELQAAFAVAAGFGSLTTDIDPPNLLTEKSLDADKRQANNLIFVGMPEKLTMLTAAAFPAPPKDGQFSIPGMQTDDGVLQMAISPWNSENVVMLVSGVSESGLLKAARALGTGDLVAAVDSSLSVVSAVNFLESELQAVPVDRTLDDLGYENTILGGGYGRYAAFNFTVVAEQADSTEAYVDLTFSYSGLLSTDKTGMSIFLNGVSVGGVQYDEDTSQISTTRLQLLPGVLRRGTNTLEVLGDLIPRYNCYSPDLSSTLVTIGKSSLIHIPVSLENVNLQQNLNMKDYPYMFLTDKYMQDLVFVLPVDDTVTWDYAARVAFMLGNASKVSTPALQVVYATNVSEEVRNQNNLLIFGLAEDLPIIAELNNNLPSPYEDGTNEAIQPALLVNYRLLPGVSVGYLQLLASPWNTKKSILTVMGNDRKGIPMAANAILDSTLAATLKGNFSVAYGDQVLSADTRLGDNKQSLIADLPVSMTVTPPARVETGSVPIVTPASRAGWILPVLIVLILLIAGITLVIIRNAIVGSRSAAGKNRSAKS